MLTPHVVSLLKFFAYYGVECYGHQFGLVAVVSQALANTKAGSEHACAGKWVGDGIIKVNCLVACWRERWVCYDPQCKIWLHACAGSNCSI